MDKIRELAHRLKKIRGLRLNKLYKICEQEGLDVQEIETIKYLINERNNL